MVCHKCNQQMKQAVRGGLPVGFGFSSDTEYETCEVKECKCGNMVLEEYRANVCDEYKVKLIIEKMKQSEEAYVKK